MSTSGSYTVPDVPCDETIYTPAALRALRDAGSLRINCHYRVQADPIGTAGNTSPVVIELHATAADHLSMEGKAQTNFYTDAWHCIFDLDLGPNGSYQEITDNWNNNVRDPDPDSGVNTIVNQFPFHLGSDLLRDNVIDDCLFPGLAPAVSAGVEFRDNTLRESTIDLTGVTSGAFSTNQFTSTSFTTRPANLLAIGNTVGNATISNLGTGTSFAFLRNTFETGALTVANTVASNVTLGDNTIGGINGGYRILVHDKPTGTVNLSGNHLSNRASGSQELDVSGTSDVVLIGNTVTVDSTTNQVIVLAGTGPVGSASETRIETNRLDSASINNAGSGQFTLSRSTVIAATVDVQGANAGPVFFNDVSLTDQAVVTVNKPDQQFVFNGTRMRGGTVSVTGSSPFSSTRDDLTNPNWTDAGGVAVTSNWSSTGNTGGGTISRAAGHDFAVTLNNNLFQSYTMNIGAGARSVSASNNRFAAGTATVNGGQLIATGNTFRASNFTMSGTRGLVFTDCDVHSTTSFTQSSTGGAGTDGFLGSVLQRATVSITGAVDPGSGRTLMNVCTVLFSTVNFADPTGTGTVVLQSTEVLGQSTLNVQAGALLHDRCRFSNGCVLNTGAFAAQSTIVEGAFTKTWGANQVNRYCGKPFDDVL